MTTQRNTGKSRILLSTTRLNSKEASQINFCGSPTTLGRHTGESPATSTLSLASSRVVSDLPAYILVSSGTNCLEMTTRNSKPRVSLKQANLDLHETLHDLFDLAHSGSYSQLLLNLQHYYEGDEDINDISLMISTLSVTLCRLEKTYKVLHNPSLKLKAS